MTDFLTRLRIAFGLIREGDPDAWRCDWCSRWNDGDTCPNHRVRVLRAPRGPRPTSPTPPPPRYW